MQELNKINQLQQQYEREVSRTAKQDILYQIIKLLIKIQ